MAAHSRGARPGSDGPVSEERNCDWGAFTLSLLFLGLARCCFFFHFKAMCFCRKLLSVVSPWGWEQPAQTHSEVHLRWFKALTVFCRSRSRCRSFSGTESKGLAARLRSQIFSTLTWLNLVELRSRHKQPSLISPVFNRSKIVFAHTCSRRTAEWMSRTRPWTEKPTWARRATTRTNARLGSQSGWGVGGGHLAEGFCAFMLEVRSSESRRGRATRARRTTVRGKRAGTGVWECRERICSTTGEKWMAMNASNFWRSRFSLHHCCCWVFFTTSWTLTPIPRPEQTHVLVSCFWQSHHEVRRSLGDQHRLSPSQLSALYIHSGILVLPFDQYFDKTGEVLGWGLSLFHLKTRHTVNWADHLIWSALKIHVKLPQIWF